MGKVIGLIFPVKENVEPIKEPGAQGINEPEASVLPEPITEPVKDESESENVVPSAEPEKPVEKVGNKGRGSRSKSKKE